MYQVELEKALKYLCSQSVPRIWINISLVFPSNRETYVAMVKSENQKKKLNSRVPYFKAYCMGLITSIFIKNVTSPLYINLSDILQNICRYGTRLWFPLWTVTTLKFFLKENYTLPSYSSKIFKSLRIFHTIDHKCMSPIFLLNHL